MKGNAERFRKQCGRKSAAARCAATVLILSLLFSGCSLPGGFLQRKPTAVSLAKAAMENVQKARSAAVRTELGTNLSFTYDQLGIGMKMKLHADVDMEITKDPRMAKGVENLEINVMGQTQTIDGKFYLDASDGSETTYQQWENGKWMKKPAQSGSGSEGNGSNGTGGAGNEGTGSGAAGSGGAGNEGTGSGAAGSGAGSADSGDSGSATGIPGGMSALQTIGVVKAIAEEAMSAELLEETETIYGKEAYQLRCTLTGDFLRTMLEAYGQNLLPGADTGAGTDTGTENSGGTGSAGTAAGEDGSGSSTAGLDKINWGEVEIPARIYIYKESSLPARIILDCRTIGRELAGSLVGDSLDSIGDLPVGSISIDVDSFDVEITFDRYDEIDPIEIPQEVLQAEETQSLAPAVTDVLGW